MADEKIRIFRPLLNAKRLQSSCKAVSLEPPPFDLFLEALRRVVADNSDFVPPYGSGGSLYIRPFVIGSGVKIGLSPSPETTFMIFVNPVGNYYAGGIGSPVKALIMHGFDRAAPRGTGNVKVGGNYAPCLRPSLVARKKGYTITLFLDAKTGKVYFY
jgi:branched-chain amino acid aminotransferase